MLWSYGMGGSQLTAAFTGLNQDLCTEIDAVQQPKKKQKCFNPSSVQSALGPPCLRVSCTNLTADCGLLSVLLWSRCHSTRFLFKSKESKLCSGSFKSW